MSKLTLRSRIAHTLRSAHLNATPVAAGSALLALSIAGSAMAQQAPAQSGALEEVVVTGIRKSIEESIAIKRDQDIIVEAITAEDIGKLPDTTIAESLARLPGVTTQRDRFGNATSISIRGLGPDFNGYLLNGREQTSTDNSRAVDLSVYPAELIGGAVVYKSGDASLTTAGLAGTIDARLVDPLSYHNTVIQATGEKTKNGVGLPVQGKGNRYTLSYVDQFADRTIGIAIGFVHSKSNSGQFGNGSWGGNHNATDTNGNPIGTNGQEFLPFGGGLQFETDLNNDKRDSGVAILEYKPNDAFSSEFDMMYAKRDISTEKFLVQRGTGYGGDPLINATVSNGVVTSGTLVMGPYDLIDRNESLFDNDTVQSYGWKNTLKFSDDWSATLDLSHNSAKRVERDIETYAGIATADTLSFTNGGAPIPSFTLGNPSAYTNPSTIAVHDVSGWSGVNYPAGSPYAGQTVPQAGYSKGPTITDSLSAVRLEFHHKMSGGMFSGADFGVNYTDRSKKRLTDEGLIVSANNGGYDPIPFPAGSFVENNVGGTGLNMLAFFPQAGLWPGAVILRKYNDDILSKTWTVDEKVTTGFVKFNIDTRWADIPVRGNVGLQIVNTDQSSGGYRADVSSNVTLTNPAETLSVDGAKYTDILPSLNLTGDLGNGNLLRFAASTQLARPSLTDMRNSLAAAVDQTSGTSTQGTIVGSAGNPHLKPFKATGLDLSWEKYFQSKAYVSAAVFYKHLQSYILPATNHGTYDFTNIASSIGLAIPTAGPLGTFTETQNGSGGNLKGIELAASVPLNMVASWLDGFGLMANFSSTTSSVVLPNLIGANPSQQVAANGQTIPLPGLSHINDKAVFYYERGGFSAFVAENYRSQYVGSVANSATVGGYPALIFIAPQHWVSAQVGYELQSGPAKGLGVRFEANNLNKPRYVETKYDGSNNYSTQTGATYAFRINYRFAN
jgi:iron complex outermembrane receptor protein